MIEWKDEYQTEIKEIDNHHHKLFEAVNRAYELSCKADEGVMNKKTVEKFINELTDITLHQFYIEEEFMLSINFKGLFWHKMDHEDFMKNITIIKEKDLKDKPEKYLDDFIEFYTKWTTQHILMKDKQISQQD